MTDPIAYRVPPYIVCEPPISRDYGSVHGLPLPFEVWKQKVLAECSPQWRVKCETCKGEGVCMLPCPLCSGGGCDNCEDLGVVYHPDNYGECLDCDKGFVSIKIGDISLKQAAHFPSMPQSLIDSILDSSSIADDSLHLAWLCVARPAE